MINRDRVGFIGYGYGTITGLPFLASDAAGSERVRSAVLGFAADAFPGKECIKERSAGGLSLRHVEVPGTEPSPPPAPFSRKLKEWAAKISVPIHYAANEKDERAPLERSRELFDCLSGKEGNRWEMLQGSRSMTVKELHDQMSWLLTQVAAAPIRPPPPPPPKPLARPVEPAGAKPNVPVKQSAAASERPRQSARTSERSGGRASERSAEGGAKPKITAQTKSLQARMAEARKEIEEEESKSANVRRFPPTIPVEEEMAASKKERIQYEERRRKMMRNLPSNIPGEYQEPERSESSDDELTVEPNAFFQKGKGNGPGKGGGKAKPSNVDWSEVLGGKRNSAEVEWMKDAAPHAPQAHHAEMVWPQKKSAEVDDDDDEEEDALALEENEEEDDDDGEFDSMMSMMEGQMASKQKAEGAKNVHMALS